MGEDDHHPMVPPEEYHGEHLEWPDDNAGHPVCGHCGADAETFGCVRCGGWRCSESGETLFQV